MGVTFTDTMIDNIENETESSSSEKLLKHRSLCKLVISQYVSSF